MVSDFGEKVFHALLKATFFSIRFCVIDFETTGFDPETDEIIEIGAVECINYQPGETFHTFVQPNKRISTEITKITGINNDMLMSEPMIDEVKPNFLSFVKGAVLVEHSISKFDLRFLKRSFGITTKNCYLNTFEISKRLFPKEKKHDLRSVCDRLDVKLNKHHYALNDAMATTNILIKSLKMLEGRGYRCLSDIHEMRGLLKWL